MKNLDYLVETFYPSTVWTTSQQSTYLFWRVTTVMLSWYQDHSQCSAKPEKSLYLFKKRSQRSWNRWSDRASLNRYSQEESIMHLQWCGRERRVENWDFVWTWNRISVARSRMRITQYQTWRRSSTTYMGPQTLAKLCSQMPTINLNMTNKQKIYAQSTHLRDCSRCADYLRDREPLPQCSRIASNRPSKESKPLWYFKTMCWCMELPRRCLTKQCLQSIVDNVKKILLFMKKKLNVEKIMQKHQLTKNNSSRLLG